MVQLTPLPSHHLLFIKILNGLPFWCWITQAVLEKRLLNGYLVFIRVWSYCTVLYTYFGK